MLEEKPDVALVRPQAAHVATADHDRAFVRLLEPGDQAQDCRLAAAAGPKQRYGLSGRHRKRDVRNRDDAAETLRDSAEFDGRCHRGP